ncbi:universal stress protein [Roseibium salinum]|uniref:Universal stress protein n=1 Tax=Roseibium salinum TaxID=1604349 RepID=A0ABT3QWK2_9HYPH|nr:universal stress protein [Roseibium sp. DSM 29163]MCX2721302.1 universal stress protein [Roseibium sp. DSM 29163]
MSIKRIFLPIPGNTNPVEEIQLALSAATFLEAHIEALFISEPPQAPTVPQRGVPFSEFSGVNQFQDVAVEHGPAEAGERAARDMRERFSRACGLNHIPLISGGTAIDTFPSARWMETDGDYSSITINRAAAFDLVVAGSEVVAQSLREVAEIALLRTGRPVLLAPMATGRALNETALIAWKNSPQCWHAVSAAIPFLQRAHGVEIVSVGHEDQNIGFAHKDLIDYLSCHGVTATSSMIGGSDRSVGETLLAEAGTRNAGLLVMGAYSHSRIRDFLIGGVTKHVLANAAATAVLMAH